MSIVQGGLVTEDGSVLTEVYNTQVKALNLINELENEIVNGNVYSVAVKYPTLNTGDVIRFGATTPADKDIRLFPADLTADANYVQLEVYEDVVFDTPGGLITPINHNRQAGDNSGVLVYSTFGTIPSVVGKTRIDIFATLGGTNTGQKSTGGAVKSDSYFILKRNTNYLFVNTNFDGDGVTAIGKATYVETDLTD